MSKKTHLQRGVQARLTRLGGRTERTAVHRVRWIRYFLDSARKNRLEEIRSEDLDVFCENLEGLGNRPEWQIDQARQAVEWFFRDYSGSEGWRAGGRTVRPDVRLGGGLASIP